MFYDACKLVFIQTIKIFRVVKNSKQATGSAQLHDDHFMFWWDLQKKNIDKQKHQVKYIYIIFALSCVLQYNDGVHGVLRPSHKILKSLILFTSKLSI